MQAEVAEYLADCIKYNLHRKYHPTEDGAVKMIFHRRHHDQAADDAAEQAIRDAYREMTKTSG